MALNRAKSAVELFTIYFDKRRQDMCRFKEGMLENKQGHLVKMESCGKCESDEL